MDFLYCPCPAAGCENKKINYWRHEGCGSKTMIRYNDIYIICSGCYKNAIMFDWRFSCSEHGFKSASKQGCLYALSILGLHKGNEDQIREATLKLLQNWPKSTWLPMILGIIYLKSSFYIRSNTTLAVFAQCFK